MTVQNRTKKPIPGNKEMGFTAIEIICVLIFLGIFTAVAAVTLSGDRNELITQTDAFQSYLKYAQSKSMGTTSNVFGMAINAANDSYWIFSCPSTGACTWQDTKAILPGNSLNNAFEDTVGEIQPIKVGVEILGSDQVIIFDKIGRPFQGPPGNINYSDPLADTPGLTLITTPLGITFSKEHDSTKFITTTIIPETGFIQ